MGADGDALATALGALAQKERTVSEVAELLERRGFGAEEARGALEELIAEGTLDDARFARLFAEDKREISGWGSERIRETLLRRGVDRTDVEAALEAGGEDELERAVSLIAERGFTLSEERDRARALGLLARRGYESELAYDAVRRAERSY